MPVEDTDAYEPSPWDFIADQVERYLATDGEEGYELEGKPCVILTTKGRKSGKLRRTPLMRVKDGDRYFVVASLGGAANHPVWYLNLSDDPDVTLQDKGDVHAMRARTASPEEKAELWPKAVEVWPDYANYQASTDRDIPLVVLDPPVSTVDTDLPYCYVTTTGRVTGKDHEIEIWFAGDDDALYLVSGGQDRSDWVQNLRASGTARVRVGDDTVEVSARVPLDTEGDDGRVRHTAVDALYDKYGDQVTASRADWHRNAFVVALDLRDASSS